MYGLTRSLLFRLPAEPAHRLGLFGLRELGHSQELCQSLRGRALRGGTEALAVEVAGLRFAHPVALAAGLDKDAEAVDGLFACGFSAVEIGTLTPVS
ncbi:dihydroorotate dehydrogenase (quinone), partial [Myxococcus llanfairpwllgwyngyllgogerychwyrndrobwllllantysiliogogogochensis]